MISVQPVATSRELDEFIRLPWRLYAGDRNWVPPLVSAERKLMSRELNPFFRTAEIEYFIARREGRAVGRIAAIVNRRHNEIHGERTGFWGFLECEEDQETAASLLAAAEAWLRARGMDRSRGPANPSMNDPCGLLIDGFKWPPFVLMTYNPPGYAKLVEAAGYAKSMDLYAYILLHTELVREKIDRVAAAVRERGDVRIECVDLSNFEAELRRVMAIYNDAWERNWGFVPMSEDEIRFVADDMKSIVLPEFVYFARYKGEDAGFALALPDINHSLKRANGSLLPFGWFWFLKWSLRRIPALRLVALGVRRKFQHLGIGTLFYQRYIEEGLRRGYKAAELSWVLESNDLMNRPIQQLGAKPYKTYRLYDKPLKA